MNILEMGTVLLFEDVVDSVLHFNDGSEVVKTVLQQFGLDVLLL